MPTLERFSPEALRSTVITFRDTMKAHAEGINRLNVYPVPDGDTGTNMARTLDAVVAELDLADLELEPTCNAISHGSLMGARGNSGVILSQILRGLVGTLKGATDLTATKVAEGLKAASAAAYQSVLKPIEGTILTVVRESADAGAAAAADGATLVGMLRAARSAAKAALDNTPELLPVLKDAGVVDAGGAGYLLFLDSALFVVDGEPLPLADEGAGPSAAQLELVSRRHTTDGSVDVSEQRYEVMYFVDLADAHIEEFKQSWGEIGDSIVVVGGDGLWNCHVHTNDIGAAIETALQLDGRPKQIRVTDLFEEVADEHAVREAALRGSRHSAAGFGLPAVTCAVVAVASGDGLAELFGQLGVQGVVTGGQTLNPSTAELLAAVEDVPADDVVILPNNKNIVPVAEQVQAHTGKRVRVVPTRGVAEGFAALMAYDPEAPGEENEREMCEASEHVVAGEVTRAVRSSSCELGPIAEGDWLGISRQGIRSIDKELWSAATGLLADLLSADHEIVTLIEGEGANAGATRRITEWVAEHHPDVSCEIHHGGQPLYPYYVGIE
ncbi:MAG TPA: DAK2 domain-containing protein [Ilumatobacteraceae bacterium]|nr:DAK2 domain-containing protein [Ilumatobacteraceae bacterium]